MIDLIADNATIIGLVFFFSFFVAMLFWICRPGAKTIYKNYGEIPLKEGEDV